MAVELLTHDELYNIGKNAVQAKNPNVTDFSEGSIADIIVGTAATMAEELQNILVDRFNRTYLELAEGSDLETLLTDHFGDDFARPQATQASGVVEFSRPTFTAGAVTIPAGTVVSTTPDGGGNAIKFQTEIEVNLGPTDLTVNASVIAQVAGSAGNVISGQINVIDSSLTDATIVVSNAATMSGGTEEATDAEYREFARNKIETIRGGTCAAIEAAAKTVAGVENSKAVESEQTVIGWNPATSMTVGTYFTIPRAKLYISDANGTANQALIDAVKLAVNPIRACGIFIEVIGASPVTLQWDFSITLDPGGPNYAALSVSPLGIRQSAQTYINNLSTGQDFIRADAEASVLAIWGPAGTGDLTGLDTNVPSGDVDADPTEKFVANLGDVTVS